MIEQASGTIARVMRAAIKVGDDFFTLEECVTLPVGADDQQIAEAVATGLRIFKAQQSAIEEQIGGLRTAPAAARTPNLASTKQLTFIERLAGELGHTIDSAAEACGFSAASLTSDQASQMIDALKNGTVKPVEASYSPDRDDLFGSEQPPADPDEPVPAASAGQPITQQQQRAISALCQVKNVTIQQAITDHFEQTIALETLSQQQAGSLIAALNARQPAPFIGATPKAVSRRK